MKYSYWLRQNTDWLRRKKAEGYSDREIAIELGCSLATVNKACKELNIPRILRSVSYQFKLSPVIVFSNNFEEIAYREYINRGYRVNKAHRFCKFDFLVNGIRVDVKGANKQKDGRFRVDLKYESLKYRCDILHLIISNDSIEHLLVPSVFIPTVTQIEILTKKGVNPRFQDYIENWKVFSKTGTDA